MASWDSSVNIQPDYDVAERHEPTVREVRFGNGFVKSMVFGLNQDLARWDLRFSNLTTTEANTIKNFLRDRKGSEAFDWTAPYASSASKYKCKTWQISIPYANTYTISALFEEVAIP